MSKKSWLNPIFYTLAVFLALGCIEQAQINETVIPTTALQNQTQSTPTTKTPLAVTSSYTVTYTVTSEINTHVKTTEMSSTSTSVVEVSEFMPKLCIPEDVEYIWIDLNESLRTVTIEGITYETGIIGKAYIPKEIKPDKKHIQFMYSYQETQMWYRPLLLLAGVFV